MTITEQDSSEVLRQEILADARRESEEILDRARREAEGLLRQADAGAQEARLKRLDEARAEGARRRELTLAAVFVEIRRLRLARIEALLQSLRDEAARQLASRSGFDYRESVVALAAEAVRRMAGDAFTVRLAEKDRSLTGDVLAEEIAARAGRPGVSVTISYEAAVTADGPVVEDTAGSQACDMSYPARLGRLWPQMRRLIAGEMFPVGQDGTEGGTRDHRD